MMRSYCSLKQKITNQWFGWFGLTFDERNEKVAADFILLSFIVCPENEEIQCGVGGGGGVFWESGHPEEILI